MKRPKLPRLTLSRRDASARIQRDPTPTTVSVQIVTPPTEAPKVDQIAIPPSPTPTLPSSTLSSPTPTPGSFTTAPTATPTPRRVTPTPTATLQREAIEPTATQTVITQPESEGETEQQFPCPPGPTPYNPFGWLCWPSPDGPSFPVFPSKDVTDATSIHWYGVRMDDPFADEQATGTGWGMESVAWSKDGREVSRCTMASEDGKHRWLLADASTRLEGEFSVETDSERRGQLVGTINGQSYAVPIGADAQLADSSPLPALELAHSGLLAHWVPLFQDLGGLLDIAVSGGGGETAGSTKCAVAGMLVGPGCLATLSAALVGVFVCDDIIDGLAEWCLS